MAVKFGLSQIKEPSPKAVKLLVNLFIVLGGAAGSIVMLLPTEYLTPEQKTLILGIGGIMAGTLKAIEKLLGTNSPANDDVTNG